MFHKTLNAYSHLKSECMMFHHEMLIMSCVTNCWYCLVTLVGSSQSLSMSCFVDGLYLNDKHSSEAKCLEQLHVVFYFMKKLPQSASAQQLFMYQRLLTFNNSTLCPRSPFLCFIWISEQTTVIYLYIIQWLAFYNQEEMCFLRGANWVFKYNSGSCSSSKGWKKERSVRNSVMRCLTACSSHLPWHHNEMSHFLQLSFTLAS
jgi:hypothetical protein